MAKLDDHQQTGAGNGRRKGSGFISIKEWQAFMEKESSASTATGKQSDCHPDSATVSDTRRQHG